MLHHHPDKNYLHKDVDLLNSDLYRSMRKPFGKANLLPDLAYVSKNFSELEDEKLWTRGWIAVGCQAQIPNPNDLLPFTVGNHGIHVQRNDDGSLSARFNKAQHGGCRAIPLQCQTGKKTRCSFTSCGYSRDRDVISADELNNDTRAMQQYIGLIPERLLLVNVDTWGPFIFVNLDSECTALKETFDDWDNHFMTNFETASTSISEKRNEYACNWKHAGRSLFTDYPISINQIKEKNTFSALTETSANLYTWSIALKDAEALNFALPTGLTRIPGMLQGTDDKVFFCWAFPNILICFMPTHLVAVILQPVGMGVSEQRMFVLMHEDGANSTTVAERLCDDWANYFRYKSLDAEHLQLQMDAASSVSPGITNHSNKLFEEHYAAYLFQQYLLNKILHKHKYAVNSPIYMHVNP